jgi:hypothetical protein
MLGPHQTPSGLGEVGRRMGEVRNLNLDERSARVTWSIRAAERCAAGSGVLELAPALTQPACWCARPPTRLAELWVHGVERAVRTFTRASSLPENSSELEHARACGQDTVVRSGSSSQGVTTEPIGERKDHRKRSLTTPAGRRGQQAGSPRSPTSMPARVALPRGDWGEHLRRAGWSGCHTRDPHGPRDPSSRVSIQSPGR